MSDLIDDLGAWESGHLSAEAVTERHPEADVPSLLAVHQRLTLAESAPVPDASMAWAALAHQLPDRHGHSLRWRRSVVAAVMATVITVPGVAYATQAPVRDAVRDVFGTDHAAPAVSPEDGSQEPTPAADDDRDGPLTTSPVDPVRPSADHTPVPPATVAPDDGADAKSNDDLDPVISGDDASTDDESDSGEATGGDDHSTDGASDGTAPADHGDDDGDPAMSTRD